MLIYRTYRFVGHEQRWSVPKGVTEATFECWGAAGGVPSYLTFHGRPGETKGGSGPRNNRFTNNPRHPHELGHSYSNNAGYVSGTKDVDEGEVYYIRVGGNGGPGHSTIRQHHDQKHYSIGVRGGAGGWNGGGDGGKGAHVYQNLYNADNTRVHYRRNTLPPAAKKGQTWLDTGVVG